MIELMNLNNRLNLGFEDLNIWMILGEFRMKFEVMEEGLEWT
jgi:hypothetical protein